MPRRTPPPQPEPVPACEIDSEAVALLAKQVERLTDAVSLLTWAVSEAGGLWLPTTFANGALLPSNLQRLAHALDTPAALAQPALVRARQRKANEAGANLFDSVEGQG